MHMLFGQPLEGCTATQNRLIVVDATSPNPAVIEHLAHTRGHLYTESHEGFVECTKLHT